MSRQLIGKIIKRRNHSAYALQEGQDTKYTEEVDPTLWDEIRLKCVFEETEVSLSRRIGSRQNDSFQEESHELDHALDWESVTRKSQITLTFKFATFRVKSVLEGIFMFSGYVILKEGDNTELRL